MNKENFQSATLINLGNARVLSIRGVDDQIHVAEFGMHWNFFFTLVALSLLTRPPLPCYLLFFRKHSHLSVLPGSKSYNDALKILEWKRAMDLVLLPSGTWELVVFLNVQNAFFKCRIGWRCVYGTWSSHEQFATILTNPLTSPQFYSLIIKLMVLPKPLVWWENVRLKSVSACKR